MNTKCVFLFLLLLSSVRLQIAAADEADLSRAIKESTQVDFHQPPQPQLRQFHDLAAATLNGKRDFDTLHAAWLEFGWELKRESLNDQVVWLLHKSDRRAPGSGFFAIRPNAKADIILQAPHSFYDQHTRAIAARLFEISNFRAAAWNTVHRRTADMAHLSETYLQQFTRAFVASSERPLIVQIHGFSQSSRKTRNGSRSDIILSNGTRYPDLSIRLTAQQLVALTPNTRLYPTEIRELGATTNRQGMLAQQTNARFLHLELSRPMRLRLLQDKSVRHELLKSILVGYRN